MKLAALNVICSILQIVGLIMIILVKQLPAFTPVLIGIAGFAAIVRFFLPGASGFEKDLRPIAAIAGFGIIVFACII